MVSDIIDVAPKTIGADNTTVFDRLTAIISPYVEIRDNNIWINIPLGDKSRACLLRPKRGGNDDVQAWAMKEYARLYPGEKLPQVREYKTVRDTIILEANIPEAEEKSAARGRAKSQRSLAVEAAMRAVWEDNDLHVPAATPGAYSVRVPYLKECPEYMGTWLVTERSVTRLIDAAFYPTELYRPDAASKSANFFGTMRVVNSRGEEKILSFDRETLEKGLDAKLKGFARWPELPTSKYRLYEALNAFLQCDKACVIHDRGDSLGWIIDRGELQWLCNNGIETERDFIPSERAAIAAPDIKSAGNGYRGSGNTYPLSADILELCFERINPRGTVRRLAKLGAWARVKFPEGTVENAGVLDFAIETVGDGTGQGKSSEDNRILSLDGLDFKYNLGTYFTEKDSPPARAKGVVKIRYTLAGDYDRKARPGNKAFTNQHESRKNVITLYADKNGGVKTTDHGREEVSRGEGQGGLLLTGNYDHSQWSLAQPDVEEDAYEFRVCTFVLPRDEIADQDISIAIEARHGELYAWGRAFRAWMMQQYNSDRAAFALRVQQWQAQADSAVREIDYTWNHYRQKNATIDLVWGLCAWRAFLEDTIEEYATHYLYKLIQDNITDVIVDRITRDEYLQTLIDKRERGVPLAEFVVQTIRFILDKKLGHLRGLDGKVLEEEDFLPYSLEHAGYRLSNTPDNTQYWQFGGDCIAWYRKRKQDIILTSTSFFDLLERTAFDKKYPLPSRNDVKQKLLELGILTEAVTNVARGESKRYYAIPYASLGYDPQAFRDEEEEAEREALLDEVDRAKITHITDYKPEIAPPAQQSLPVKVAAQGGQVEILLSRSDDPFDIDDGDIMNFDPMA